MNVSNIVFVQSKFFTIQGKYFTTGVCKCMHAMICMILTGLLWSGVMIAAVLYQSLADLNIGCLEVGTSDVRASDVVPFGR